MTDHAATIVETPASDEVTIVDAPIARPAAARLRVVHVLKHSHLGNGNVHVAVDVAIAQVEAGHEVHLVSGPGDFGDLLEAHGVTFHALPEPVDARSALAFLRAFDAIARDLRPQVIHAHMMSGALLGLLVARRRGAALVTTVHNSFDGHSKLMRVGDRVIAVSDAERDLLISRGFSARRVMTVFNGTAGSAREAAAPRAAAPATLSTPAIMTLSGLHGRKAVDDIIRAFALVAPDFPEWHLNIVGEGPDRDLLGAQVDDAGLADRVHFLGHINPARDLLDQASIVVSASLAEPCALSIMEARVAGCAVVTTAVGGFPEMLDHGDSGHLVPTRTPEAIATALREMLADPDRLALWRARAEAGAAERFSVQRVRADHDAVYLSIPRVARRAE